MVSRAQRETTKSKHMHPNSPRLLDYPSKWDGVLYFRSEAVLGLPVSTTSYSRHTVSTVQTWSAGPTTVRSLIDTDGAKITKNPVMLPYLYFIIIPRPVSIFLHSILHFISHILKNKDIIYLASNWRLLDFYPIAREWQEITRLLPGPIKHSSAIDLHILV